MEAGYANDTISVIVPVYNSEKRLERCIASLVNQTYQNLQIILVDDGSKDRSGGICDSWAEKDNRVLVVHQKNGGVGKARNVGLDTARGEYVAFVDSDDYIDLDMYMLLITAAHLKHADQVCCCMKNIFPTGKQEECHAFSNQIVRDQQVYSELILSLLNPNQESGKARLLQSPCNKLYRRDIVEQYGIRFDTELTYAEDWLFNVNFYRFAKCVAFIPEHLYFYDRSTEGSLTKKFRWDGFDQSIKIRDYERTWFPDLRTNEEYCNLILHIQSHYLSLYANLQGLVGFGEYTEYLFKSEKLQEAYLSTQNVPVTYKIPQFCIKHTGSEFYRGMYQAWAVAHICVSVAKYYAKKMINRSRNIVRGGQQ